MSASSTCLSLNINNLGIITARCTGFAKVHTDQDYSYVIDLEWTDERNCSIKRTFVEIVKFHHELIKLFPELRHLEKTKLNLRTSFRDNVTSLFTKDKRAQAESREALLDTYLINLIRQPERIRHSNLVLSFFESRITDPKPCKASSPSEKSDSGIDLTSDKESTQNASEISSSNHSTATQHNNDEMEDPEMTDEEYLNLHCDVETECAPRPSENDYEDDYESDEEYEETETETDDEFYDEDYFLDVGFGELMLQNSIDEDQSDPASPTEAGPDTSMWCSNLSNFSSILRTSMSNLHSATESPNKSLHKLTSIEDEEIQSALTESQFHEENSDTESQQVHEDRQNEVPSPYESSDEESYSKSLSKSDSMKHYYLSTNNLNVIE